MRVVRACRDVGVWGVLLLGTVACSVDRGPTPGLGGSARPQQVETNQHDAGAIDDPDAGDASGPSMDEPDAAVEGPLCGNGMLEAGETCDPRSACPAVTDCLAPHACIIPRFVGSAETCSAQCDVSTMIAVCADGDGCCPPSCNSTTDADCSATCGNGVLEAEETCEPGSVLPCPDSCDDGNPCTKDALVGSADNCNAACVHTDIVAPAEGDGCCPPGANANADADCNAICGNDVLESAEICEPRVAPGCSPDCSDGDACTRDLRQGAPITCDVVCAHPPVIVLDDDDGCCPAGANADNDKDCEPECGNHVVEVAGSEICEPGTSLPCPASCDDGNPCTKNVLVGSAATCDARCTYPPVTEPADDDDCCPEGATSGTDNDCSPSCGNGVLDPGEICEVGVGAGCPASCDDDDPCSVDIRTGTPAQCNVLCTHVAIVEPSSGDQCCPDGANANNDTDCPAVCGNGVVETGETCEPNTSNECAASCSDGDPCTTDVRSGSPDKCDVVCENTPVTQPKPGDLCCPPGANQTTDSDCVPECGNGVVEKGETCDDAGDNGRIGYCNARCSRKVPTFEALYDAVIAKKCGPCHLTQKRGNLDMSTALIAQAELIGVVSGCAGLIRVVAGDPDASLLVKKVDPDVPLPASCPSSNEASHLLPAAELGLVRDWILGLGLP